MAMVVWVMMGIAIWHFAVFVPDRFYGGIVGAFLAAIAGAALFGFLVVRPHHPRPQRHRAGAGADRDPRRGARPGALVVLRLAHRGRAPPRGALARRVAGSVPLAGQDGPVLPDGADGPASPTTSPQAAALADELGLSPATAAILTRRGYGDPAERPRLPRCRRSHRARAARRSDRGSGADQEPPGAGHQDRRLRRLRRGRRLLHGDDGPHAAQPGRRPALAPAEPRRGLRALRSMRSVSCTSREHACSSPSTAGSRPIDGGRGGAASSAWR